MVSTTLTGVEVSLMIEQGGIEISSGLNFKDGPTDGIIVMGLKNSISRHRGFELFKPSVFLLCFY